MQNLSSEVTSRHISLFFARVFRRMQHFTLSSRKVKYLENFPKMETKIKLKYANPCFSLFIASDCSRQCLRLGFLKAFVGSLRTIHFDLETQQFTGWNSMHRPL